MTGETIPFAPKEGLRRFLIEEPVIASFAEKAAEKAAARKLKEKRQEWKRSAERYRRREKEEQTPRRGKLAIIELQEEYVIPGTDETAASVTYLPAVVSALRYKSYVPEQGYVFGIAEVYVARGMRLSSWRSVTLCSRFQYEHGRLVLSRERGGIWEFADPMAVLDHLVDERGRALEYSSEAKATRAMWYASAALRKEIADFQPGEGDCVSKCRRIYKSHDGCVYYRSVETLRRYGD